VSCIEDTESVDLTIVGGVLSADLIVDAPAATAEPNPLEVASGGTRVDGADGWLELPVTLAFSSADDPVFVATTSVDLTGYIGPGDRIKLTQSATVRYFIVVAIAAATITLYGGTDYNLDNAAISSPFFSKAKAPIGFPLDPLKWTVELRDTASRSQATPANGTWYNLGTLSLNIPIGAWDVEYEVLVNATDVASSLNFSSTLSTTNNGETDIDFTVRSYIEGGGLTSLDWIVSNYRRKHLLLAAKTTYYLNAKSAQAAMDSIAFAGNSAPTIVRAVCAYL
jgi:hypothetical protein